MPGATMNPQIPITFTHKGESIYFDTSSRILKRGTTPQSSCYESASLMSPLNLEPSSVLSGASQQIMLMLSPHCNMACTYCILDQGRHITSCSLMPAHIAKASVDWMFNNTFPVNRPLEIILFGGEPLLNPDSIKIAVTGARILSDRHNIPIHLQIVTNLTLISDEIAKFLAENDVAVMVSIDGPRRIHNTCRRFKDGSGSYDNVIAGLSILNRYMDIKKIWARSTLTEGFSVLEVFQHLTELGFCRISLIPCTGTSSYDLSPESYSNGLDLVMERYINSIRANDLLVVHPLRMYLTKLYGFLGKNQRSHYMDCGAGLDLLAVAPNGDIYPCPSFAAANEASQWILGNVKTGLKPGQIEEFKQRVGSGSKQCLLCWYHPLCDKGCKLVRFKTGYPHSCVVKDTYQPMLWQLCLYWYAYLRDNDPATLLRIVDPKIPTQICQSPTVAKF